MAYEIAAHTADIRVRVEGKDYGNLLVESVKAMMEVLGGEVTEEEVEREILVRAKNKTELLVDFLNEVLTLAQINKESYREVSLTAHSDNEVVAILRGRRTKNFAQDVKAVTYHEAEVTQKGGKWSVSLVFDV